MYKCIYIYASVRHTHPGTSYRMDPNNAIIPYRSTSKPHRLIIETSLIKLCNTVDHTKASSDPKDMVTLGPIILAASNIDWKLLAAAHPSLSHRFIPKAHRSFFNLELMSINQIMIQSWFLIVPKFALQNRLDTH